MHFEISQNSYTVICYKTELILIALHSTNILDIRHNHLTDGENDFLLLVFWQDSLSTS